MPRTKVLMKFIENIKKRKSTYSKRLHSLVEKISELAALCGVNILFVGIKPGAAGESGITPWPADRCALKKLVREFRVKHPEKIKENLSISTYLKGEMGKEERKLVKVRQCRIDDVLTPWDRRLDDIPADGLVALYHAIREKLERIRRRIAELGSVHNVPKAAVAVAAPALQHAPTFLGDDFDLNLSDAGSSIGAQDHYYLPRDILPQPAPVQSPCNPFGGAPMPFMPFPMAAPPGLAAHHRVSILLAEATMSWTPCRQQLLGFMMILLCRVRGRVLLPGLSRTTLMPPGYGFRAAGTGAGYKLEPRAAGVWPLGTPNNPVDAAAYQLQNDTMMWSDNGVGHHALGEQEELSRLRLFHPRM